MKHYIFLNFILLILTTNIQSQPKLKKTTTYISYDLNGKLLAAGLGSSKTANIENAFSLGFEIIPLQKHDAALGFGGEIQFTRDIENDEGTIKFTTVFGVIHALFGTSKLTPIVTVRLGYDFLYGNPKFKGLMSLSGGLYYAFGGGIVISELLQCEILYSRNSGSANYHSVNIDVSYSKVSIILGLKI